MKKLVSLIAPVLNEESVLPIFYARIAPILMRTDYRWEIVFVNDGSTDNTVEVIESLPSTPELQIRLVSLARNFGKEAAMTAGLTYATGAAVIPIDCDLQDPPELIPDMLREWEAGFEVVHARRADRASDSWLKRTTAGWFYQAINAISDISIPSNVGDYRLMDRSVVNSILSFPERNRFMKGLMAAAGGKTTSVTYERAERAAGDSKFNFWRLWNFAMDGITGFSTMPLRIWTYVGGIVALFSFAYAGWIMFKTVFWGVVTPGFATLMATMLFLGGIQLIGIGVLGEYLGRVVSETKRRPLFLVGHLHGFDEGSPTVVSYDRIAARASR